MKLINHSQLKKLCRILLGLILMILPVVILLVIPSIEFSLLALLGILILMASFVMGILTICCHDDYNEYKFKLCQKFYDEFNRLPKKKERYNEWNIGQFVYRIRTKKNKNVTVFQAFQIF